MRTYCDGAFLSFFSFLSFLSFLSFFAFFALVSISIFFLGFLLLLLQSLAKSLETSKISPHSHGHEIQREVLRFFVFLSLFSLFCPEAMSPVSTPTFEISTYLFGIFSLYRFHLFTIEKLPNCRWKWRQTLTTGLVIAIGLPFGHAPSRTSAGMLQQWLLILHEQMHHL